MKKNNRIREKNDFDIRNTIGGNLSFAAKEAYNRLRTNLLFSFTQEEGCRVIGVTSSSRGEGKSTTSVNLAYSFAEMGKHVLLLDADMRLPNVYKLLNLQLSPGLSNLLVGLHNGMNVVQHSGLHKNLSVITAGDIPPNPTELLASKRMESAVKVLEEKFDYIIIDLPPVDAVADALIVSRLTHGIVLVVRENYADRKLVEHTIRQLRYHEANIVGYIINCAETDHKYYHKHYKKYGKYGSGYGYGYGQTPDMESDIL